MLLELDMDTEAARIFQLFTTCREKVYMRLVVLYLILFSLSGLPRVIAKFNIKEKCLNAEKSLKISTTFC